MGNEMNNKKKTTISNDTILEDYRWYWNNIFSSWDNVNSNVHWYPFSLEFCENIEEAYLTHTPFHYKDKIILFDYKSLKHLQIVESNAWKKKLILREKPANLRVSRLSLLNNFAPIKIDIEEEYNKLFVKEMGILLLKDAFANIQYNPNDEFACKFMNSRKMITSKLIRFIFKAYKGRIDNLINGNYFFSFEILKSMLLYDFEDKRCYWKYYLNNLTKENFSSVIIGMLIEENNLYKEIIEFPFNCDESNIYLTTYYICLCFVLNEKAKQNLNEYKAYLVSTENQIPFKPNEYYYNKTLLLASKNGFNGLKDLKRDKIIFEITIPKEPGENSYLNQSPFDVSNESNYNDEVVIFSTYSCFYIDSIKTYYSRPRKNKIVSTTIISMRVKQNTLNISIPLMTEGEKWKFGIFEEYCTLTEEQTKSVLYAKIKTRHIKYTRKMVNCVSMELYGNDVSIDELISLCSNIELMPNLLSLSLIGNNIKGEGCKILNKSLKCIPLLKYLNLSFNFMKNEDITEIQFGVLKELEFLILRVNHFTEIGMIDLVKQLKDCNYLRGLDLYDNCIGDNGLKELTKEITSFPYLQSIDLWNCSITTQGIIHLLQNLYNHQEIETINLKHNVIDGSVLVEIFINSVKTMPKLRSISFDQHYFELNQLDTIIQNFLMVNSQWKFNSYLGSLVIENPLNDAMNNNRTDSFGSRLFPRIYEHDTLQIKSKENLLSIKSNISRYYNVKTVNLEEAQISNNDFVLLSNIITQLPLIEELLLSFTQLNPKGMECLSFCLNALPNLNIIDLSSNELGDEGLKYLALGIEKCSLQEIILCWNKISNKGIKALMTQIDKLKQLKVLDLYGNNISDEGMETISFNSHYLLKLTTLNLGKNNIGNQGMSDLAECFNNFSSLIYLNLSNNKFNDEGINDFTQNMARVLSLQYLNISGNNISKEKQNALIEEGIPSSFILQME